MERKWESFTIFQIVDGRFVYRGWSVLGSHIYKETADGIAFGETGILLTLNDNSPTLTVPEGQTAGLHLTDQLETEGRIEQGRFVWVYIY